MDSLYKQRQEIAAMEQRQKKEMDKLRGEIQNSNKQRGYVNTGKTDKTLEDKLIDSAIDKGMDKLFDHLFWLIKGDGVVCSHFNVITAW